jgi:FdhD protein
MILEYQVDSQPEQKTIALTMRTPGADEDLMLGYLLTEGVLSSMAAVEGFRAQFRCDRQTVDALHLQLKAGVVVDLKAVERFGTMSSACGSCGKTSADELFQPSPYLNVADNWQIPATLILSLPAVLRANQQGFQQTGGMHAAALFDRAGQLLALGEDVGRHNALDKLIGASAKRGRLPLGESVLLLSGRISFELVQKAGMAGIKLIVAMGAPSTLALQTAERFQMTLVGFVKTSSFSIYTHPERVLHD